MMACDKKRKKRKKENKKKEPGFLAAILLFPRDEKVIPVKKSGQGKSMLKQRTHHLPRFLLWSGDCQHHRQRKSDHHHHWCQDSHSGSRWQSALVCSNSQSWVRAGSTATRYHLVQGPATLYLYPPGTLIIHYN